MKSPEYSVKSADKKNNFLIQALLYSGCTTALLHLLLWGSTSFAQAQEVPPTPSQTPITSVEAAAADEDLISGGKVWNGPPILAQVEQIWQMPNGDTESYISSGAIVITPDEEKRLYTCIHCIVMPHIPTTYTLIGGTVTGPEGDTDAVVSFISDNSAQTGEKDGRLLAKLEHDAPFMWPIEMDFSVLEKVKKGENVRVIVLAYDYNQNRAEYTEGTVHRQSGNFRCITPIDTTTDHICFTPDELTSFIPGNSGGIILLPIQTPQGINYRAVGTLRSDYFLYALNEQWVKKAMDAQCLPTNPSDIQCLTYPVPQLTPTPTGDYESFHTPVPNVTPTARTPLPTPTATATMGPRPTYTVTPRPTAVPGEKFYLPLIVERRGQQILVWLDDSDIAAAAAITATLTPLAE